jgi:vesicle coat complex subunit
MTASLDGIQQSEEALAFLAGYGWTMWSVQRFEYYLAALSILRQPVKSPDRLINTTQNAYSALQKQFMAYHHRFERASAKELRHLLPDDLPPPLRTELDELVEIRNELAHRYLRRTLESTRPPDLRSELQAVQELGQRFAKTGDDLLALMRQSVAERPPNVSDSQFEALQRLGMAAASGWSIA